MFAWPPTSQQRQGRRKSPVWPFTRTHTHVGESRLLLVSSGLAQCPDSPAARPRAQRSEPERSARAPHHQPNKQLRFGENTEHEDLVLTKKTCTSAKESLFSPLRVPLRSQM